jgi:hypothetical protein
MRTIVLIKARIDDGLPIGTEYPYTYVAMTSGMAVLRARRALLRDHPLEDAKHWDEKSEIAK